MMTLTIRIKSEGTQFVELAVKTSASKKTTSMERGTANMLATLIKVLMDKLYMSEGAPMIEGEGARMVSTIDPADEQRLSDMGVELTLDREKLRRWAE